MTWVSCQTQLSYKYRRRTHTVTPSLEESYLRIDISCASEACDSCRVGVGVLDDVGGSTAANATPTSSLSASAPHYLVPDEVAFSDLIELFELPDISNYIILTSCVKQVSLQSGRKATRLRALYRDRRRRAVLFDDLHCLDTAASASGADPSLPPALAAGLYYARHLGSRVPMIVMSDRLAGWMAAADGTDSALADNLAAAAAEGVTVLSAAEYVSRCWPPGSAVSELYDSLMAAKLAAAAAGSDGAGGGGSDAAYSPHLSQQEVEEGLAAGVLMRGVFHVSRRNPREAVVELGHGPDTALGRLVRVSGRAAQNRAMEGNVVAVRPLLLGSLPQPVNGAADAAAAAAAAAEDDPETDATAAGAAAAAAAADPDADFGAELLADAEGAGGDGEEGALAMAEAAGSSAAVQLPSAEVVAILQRDPRDVVACLSQRDEAALRARLEQQQGLQRAQGGPQPQRRPEVLVCMPLDRRLPAVVVVTRQGAALMGSRFVVRVDGWERSSRFPRGHVTRVLGRLNDLRAESDAVLVQCGINHKPFCEAALAELPPVTRAEDWRVPPLERATRRDMTGSEFFVVSIDPLGCTDVDDAMHVRFLTPELPPQHRHLQDRHQQQQQRQADEEQRVEVGVHIADVSWFVAAGGMLDGEARDRCTSVYLADRRLDMLPGLLSEQLCSLRQGVERLAVSVVWTLRRRRRQRLGERAEEGNEAEAEAEYEVEGVWFGRSVIRSRHQLHYQQAQDILDDKPPASGEELPVEHVAQLRRALRVLRELSDQIHARRVAAGALELASAELRFKTDPVTGAPCQVECKQKIPMMDVVAEMMIAANSAVAERIATAFPGCALLRNHPPPRPQAFEQVRALIEPHLGDGGAAALDPASNASLSAALERACAAAAATSDPAAATLIKSLATRAMSEAQYNSSGTTPPATPLSYHYGLALQYYTHFTSPIRRYADVVVHRQLLAALAGGPPPLAHPDLAAAAAVMNARHRQAKAAQKECSELYLLLLLHSRPHVERALVCTISAGRLELFVPTYQLRAGVALTDRRGLPRPPLQAGQPEGPAAEEDPFLAAERRGLRLSTSPEEAVISDVATGAIVWRVRLWQPVAVRLSASDHRAHGPKLALRLLDPQHPDARHAIVAAAPRPPPKAAAAAAAAAAAPARAGGGCAAAALPPHLRLLISLRDKARQQQAPTEPPPVSSAPDAAPTRGPVVTHQSAQVRAAGATSANELEPLAPLEQQDVAISGTGPARGGVDSSVRPSEIERRLVAAAVAEEEAAAAGAFGDSRVLGAPADALAATATVQFTVAAPVLFGPSGVEVEVAAASALTDVRAQGDVESVAGGTNLQVAELRARLRRVSRLEMRLLACRRGSNQERKLRERLDELKSSVRHLQA